jgi:putative transposase
MKKSRYAEERIIGILKQHEAGVKTADLCREHGISPATFYGRKSKFGGMEVSEAQRPKTMEDENRRLKLPVAELSLDKTLLRDMLRKSGKALAAPVSGRLSARPVPGQRATCPPGSAFGAGHLSLQEPPEGTDGVAGAYPGDCTE